MELTDIEEASIAAFVASEVVTFVKEEMRDGETDDGFGVTLESTDSHPEIADPEMRVRYGPRSEGGIADPEMRVRYGPRSEGGTADPEMRVRYGPRSEGGTADRVVLLTVTSCGLALRVELAFPFKVTVADEMIEFRPLPTMTEGGMMDGTVTRDGSIDSEGTESESDSLKSVVVIDPDVAVESDFLEDFPLFMLLLLLLFLGDLDFLENIFMDTSKYLEVQRRIVLGSTETNSTWE